MPTGEGTTAGRSWERQPRESRQAFAAFQAWLGQARRNVAALSRELGRSPSLLWRWHKRHRWSERALDFDREMEHQRQADLRRYRLEVIERQQRRAEEADGAGRLLLRRGLQADLGNNRTRRGGEVALRESERFLRLATDIEEGALAGDDSRKDGAPDADIADALPTLSDSELHQFIALMRERTHPEGEGQDGNSTT